MDDIKNTTPMADSHEQLPVPEDLMISGDLGKLTFVATGSAQNMAEFLRHYAESDATVNVPVADGK